MSDPGAGDEEDHLFPSWVEVVKVKTDPEDRFGSWVKEAKTDPIEARRLLGYVGLRLMTGDPVPPSIGHWLGRILLDVEKEAAKPGKFEHRKITQLLGIAPPRRGRPGGNREPCFDWVMMRIAALEMFCSLSINDIDRVLCAYQDKSECFGGRPDRYRKMWTNHPEEAQQARAYVQLFLARGVLRMETLIPPDLRNLF